MWLRFTALAMAAHLTQLSPALADLEDLDGYWQSAKGDTVVEIARRADGVRTGEIVRLSDRGKSRGYSLGDTVFKEIKASGKEVSFTLTVRVGDPKLGAICPATSVPYSAKLSGNLSDLSGSFDKGEFQTLTDDAGKPIACRFAALPGKLAASYKRIYLTPPKVVAAGFSRLDPSVPLTDLVPLQFFRVVATLDQNPIPTHAQAALITNKRTGETLKTTLRRYGTKRRIASPMVLVGLPDTDNPAPQIMTCPGDELSVKVGKVLKTITVVEGDHTYDLPPCKNLPPIPGYSLNAIGTLQRSYNPESRQTGGPLKVRLTDGAGTPLEDEEIVWQSAETGEAFVTVTDKDGVARLDFTLGRRGVFFATAEGVPVGGGFTDKSLGSTGTKPGYKFTVAPLDEVIALGIDPAPPTFLVEFVKPAQIEIWFRNKNNVTSLLYDERFFVRVWPGRYIWKRTKPLDVMLVAAGGDRLVLKAERTASGVFETTVPAHTASSSNHSDNRIAVQRRRGYIQFTAAGGQARIPVYPAKWDRGLAQALDQLALVEDVLTAAAKSPSLSVRQKSNLKIKLGLVGTANRWMREQRLSKKYKANLIEAYLTLVSMDVDDLGASGRFDVRRAADAHYARNAGYHPLPLGVRSGAPLPVSFTYEGERKVVITAFAATRNENFRIVKAEIDRMTDVDPKKIVEGLKQALIYPGLSAYTALTGWTVDGEVATSFQQVVGGAEALIGLASLGASAPWLAAVGRSAGAFVRRAAVGRGGKGGPDFSSSGTVSGLTVTKAVATEAVDHTKRRKRTIKKYMDKVDKANAKLEKLKSDRGAELATRKKLAADLETLKADVAARVARGETRNKTRLKKIGIEERKLARLDKRVKGFDAKIKKKSEQKGKAYAALGRMERDGLSKLEVKALIDKKEFPDPWDKIADRHVHRLYEDQVTKDLGGSFTKGEGIKLNSSHPGVLGKKMGQPLKDPKRQKRTKRPVMDHINKKTGDVADSKYYDFDRKKRELSPEKFEEYKKKAAREIAETVEKGRMVQREFIRKQRRNRRPPLPELDDEGKQNLVNQVVYQRQVTIVTPMKMPADVQSMIKKLVGARSAKSLRFRVIKPKLQEWAANSRF